MATDPAAAATTAAADAAKAAPTQPQNLLDTAAKPAAAANDGEWFLSEGVKGTGARPDWYKADKYKSVGEQAKAYVEAEKRIGELTAKVPKAPEKYEVTVPDDLKEAVTFNAEDPLLVEFQGFAKEAGMSQEQFSKALHMLARYEYSAEAIDLAAEKKALGDRADERLTGFTTWARAHLSEEQFQGVFAALGQRSRPSAVFAALETILQATKQPATDLKGDDVITGAKTVEDIDRKYRTPDPTTKKALIDTPEGRKRYRAELAEIVGTGDHIEVVGKK